MHEGRSDSRRSESIFVGLGAHCLVCLDGQIDNLPVGPLTQPVNLDYRPVEYLAWWSHRRPAVLLGWFEESLIEYDTCRIPDQSVI